MTKHPKLMKMLMHPAAPVVAGLLLLAVKLLLCGAQKLYLWPAGAVWDDNVMYDGAVSMASGGWLGAYDYQSLAKQSFYALWLALLHWLRVPVLLGSQLLWAGASFAGAWALSPLFGRGPLPAGVPGNSPLRRRAPGAAARRWWTLAAFAVLLFSPSSTANPAPFGFTLRIYRDAIYPALCLLSVAGMAGYALRLWRGGAAKNGWLVLAGLAFAAGCLTREDGWWLVFFVGGAALVCAGFIWLGGKKGQRPRAVQRFKRTLPLLTPFALALAGVCLWAGVNGAVYGRFTVTDFTSGPFADAYGALTRVEHENWQPTVPVPRDVRQKLYAASPAFAQLEPLLESEWYLGRYAGWTKDNPGADYSAGSFYWALREAAGERGHYSSLAASDHYFTTLAAEVNTLCDNGVLAAGARRSSVNQPIRAEYVGPVAREWLYSLGFCAVFADCDARSMWSPAGNDPVYYEDVLRPMEQFLHQSAQVITEAGGTEPYFNTYEKAGFAVFDILLWAYRLLTPLALAMAMAWQVAAGVQLLGLLRQKQAAAKQGMVWLLGLGMLFYILLRAAMIAFVEVASFNIGTYVMYLASIHPVMLLYAFLGSTGLLGLLWQRRGAKAGHGEVA